MKEQELKEYIQKYYSRENENCEWKEWKNISNSFSREPKKDMVSYVSAFANMNGGSLVIGIADGTLEIKGIESLGGNTAEGIKQRLVEQCTNLPSENLRIEEYLTDDTKKLVWIINIPKHESRKPVYAHKQAFQRIGDSLVEITSERENAILSEVIVSDDWSSKIIEDATFDDLDEEAIEKARKEFKKRNPKYANEMDAWDDIKFLNKAKVTIQGKITRTALILLGKEESEHFLNPSVCKIRWSLKTKDGENKDYDIFSIPMILAVDKLYSKIRNVKYRSIRPDTLFPDEMMRYDPFTIREPLNNCIAHQDYTKGARIEVVEYEDERLIFRNVGTFIPASIEAVVMNDCPESVYRNLFLTEAMRNLNMIETQGGGIRTLFLQQKKRCFPLPEYDFSNGNIKVVIEGNVLDETFASIVLSQTRLSLSEVMLLDKVQKRKELTDEEIKTLKSKNLISGRKPDFYLSLELVKKIDDKKLQQEYITNRSFDDDHFKKMIIDYLKKMGAKSRSEIDTLLWDKLSAVLSDEKKENKIHNLIQALRREGKIKQSSGKKWEYLSD